MKRTAMLLVSCLAMLALASIASAQGRYDISWWTVSIMLGGSYGLDGGFWPRVIPVYPVYVPVVMRNY